jgi:TM2 domain-containing membrane protein YozV
MDACTQCSTLVEPWEVACHKCQAPIKLNAAPQVGDTVPVKAELEEAYKSWLDKGKTAFKEGQLEEACNALREAIKRSGPLDGAQEKEITARKALAEALEGLNKLQEAADQYRIISQESGSHRLKEAWLKKSQDLVASSALPYELLFQKEEFRALQGDEIFYAPLYCVGCKRLLAEAEVYGLRRGTNHAVRCWCGVEGRPLAKQDVRHSIAMEEARAVQVSQRAIAIGVASKEIPGGRNKRMAIIFAISLGWVGGHKFYLGETTSGLIYAMWFWTLIPLLISLYEAIMLLEMNTTTFNMTYNIELVLQLVDPPDERISDDRMDVFSMETSTIDDVAETKKISTAAIDQIEK